MSIGNRTWREVDGERIEGTWRSAFIRNGDTYFLTDLIIYADGVIDCWDLVTPEQFAEKLRSGWIATEFEEGGRASAHHLGSWTFTNTQSWVTPDGLLGEVADEIDQLNDRPNSLERCRIAAREYAGERSEANQLAVRASYLAVPEHLRMYLGDMDTKDFPYRVLITEVGQAVFGRDLVVTEQMRERAFTYVTKQERAKVAFAAKVPADGPAEPQSPTITVPCVIYPSGWPEDPGFAVLQNNYPSPITIGSHTYPTVDHAYWALSTSDDAQRAAIAAADKPFTAEELASRAPRRAGWSDARIAVMTELLRAKFTQHPRLAEVLLATGDSRLVYAGFGSTFWVHPGRLWIGRLLELVRSELAAHRTGITTLFTH